MENLQIFNNDEFGEIRTVMINSEPWFVGKDVAAALGYGDGNKKSKALTNAIANHVDDEDKGVTEMVTPGGTQDMVIINESGVYALIFSSKLPSAKRFKRWVTGEVLPALRKTGHYEMPGTYAPKATSIGEVVNLIRVTRETMKEQGCPSADIALAVKQICSQFGVELPNCFIKPKEATMQDVYAMIDYIYSQPRGKGHKKPTYEDFIIHQSMKKLGVIS